MTLADASAPLNSLLRRGGRNRFYTVSDLLLESGETLADATIAFVTLGELAPDGRNAILVTHGFSSGAQMILSDSPPEESWSPLVGPGKPIDTNRFFVVCSNVLGSCYGSTGPGSINPATGRRYGPSFPNITLADMVVAQRKLLQHLGIEHLVMVIGPSYGGLQAFQWASAFPDFMDGVVAVAAAPWNRGSNVHALTTRLETDPNWNGGDHYGSRTMSATLAAMRVETLQSHGLDSVLAIESLDPIARRTEIERRAAAWAREFDANSLVVLTKAIRDFDISPMFESIRARVLYVLSRSDNMFPPSLAPVVMKSLASAGIAANYVEIDSDHGHFAPSVDAPKWAQRLSAFVEEISGDSD